MRRVVHGLARGCDPPRATAAPGFFLPFSDGRIVGRDHGRDDDVLRGDHLRAGVEAVGEPRLRGRAGRVRLLPDAACHGRGRAVGVNIDGRRWRLYHRGLAAPERRVAVAGREVRCDAGVKKTAFPGFISRFIFVTDLYLQTVCKKPRIGCESRPARLSTAHSLSLCKYSFSSFTKRRPVASFAARFHNDGAVAECDSPALLTKHPRASRPHRRRCNSGPRTIRTGPRLGFVD